MADETTTVGLAALVSGLVVAIDRGVAKMLAYFKKRDDRQDAAAAKLAEDEAAAVVENAQWDAINGLRKDLTEHRLETTRANAVQGTKLDLILDEVREIKRRTCKVA